MRVLLIGGTRFVGYFLAWRLLARGDEVTLLNRGTLPDPFGERVERLLGDRTSADFARLLGGREFDAVVDFAAYTDADVRGACEVLEKRAGHYVFISSGQVYLVRTDAPRPAKESDYAGAVMAEPADAKERQEWLYGVRKRAAEDFLETAWREQGFPSTRLRLPMVNGERDYYRRIEGYLYRLLDGGPVLLPGGGTEICRHVYGQDAARAIADLLGKREVFGQAFNLCQDEEPRLAELVELLAAALGTRAHFAPVSHEELRARGLDPALVSPFSTRWMSHVDPAKAKRELGFRATPLREVVGRVVATFLAQPPASVPTGYRRRAEELELAP